MMALEGIEGGWGGEKKPNQADVKLDGSGEEVGRLLGAPGISKQRASPADSNTQVPT